MNDPSLPPAAGSRRSFLRRAALVGGAVGSGALLSACSSKQVSAASAEGGGGGTGLGGGGAYQGAVRRIVNGRTVQIGWTPPVLSEWYSQMEAAAFRRMGEYEDAYGVRWKWERASPTGNFNAVEQQVQTVQSWVQRKFDVVLVCTGANFATMQGVYSKALAAGTKIYQFNQPVEIYPVEQLQAISSIGYDNRWQSGYLCGKYIAEKLGGQGKILEITGPPGSDWSAARQIGFEKALGEHPGLTVAGTANGGYLRQQGLSATQDLLTRDPDIQAIWGENEDMALGASQALDARGIKQWDGKAGVVVVGADGLVSGMQSIRNGKLTASIDVGSVDQAITFIDTVFHNAVLGETVAKIVNVPTRVVDKGNVDYAEAYLQWALGNTRKY